MNYRAEIDGLRAIAVVSVILYHAQITIFGIDRFKGGFIGVDIFFVISGYLITRIILSELEETNRFSFLRFYERRARRILPMLLLIIAVCLPFAWQRLLPFDLVDFAKSVLSAIGFGSNFFFYYSTTDYGANSALLKPLLHTWSLGIEEQFYIVFPIIILLIWRFARLSLLTLLIGMLLLSVQFADVMAVNWRNSEAFNFFLPFTRFWELLVGSLLAFVELRFGRVKNHLVVQTLPIFGLFLIAHSILFFDSNTPHPSFHTLVPIVGVALIIAFCSTDDFVGKMLSLKPIVGIGLISYSLYLWHFPIFAFNRIFSSNPSNYDKLEWAVLTFVLSVFSYFVVEKPSRNRNIISEKVFLSTILITVVGLVFVNFTFISNNGFSNRLPPILSKKNLGEAVWLNFKQNEIPCHNRMTEFCSIDNDESLTRIYAFSDSHFSSMSPQIVSGLGVQFNYTEANVGGCPFVLDVSRYITSKSVMEANCNTDLQNKRHALIGEKPSIILVGGRFPMYLNSTFFDNKEGGIEGDKWGHHFLSTYSLSFEESFKTTISSLITDGHQIVLIYPIPEVGVHVPQYIFNSIKGKNIEDIKSSIKPLTTSYDVYIERSKSTFELYDSIESPNIHRVYPHTLFCDKQILGRCVTHNDEDVFYADDDHPSAKGSEMIVKLIMEKVFTAEEILGRSL